MIRNSLHVSIVIVSLACVVSSVRAGELGFEETFALSSDRASALEELIPGTEEYYYFNCLHLQHSGKLDEVDALLVQWIDRYKRTARVIEVENRQSLLRYETSPRQSLEFLRRRLDLRFDHQRETLDEARRLPTRLDASLISREALVSRALTSHRGTARGFERRALAWAAGLDLDPNVRRDLLSRLRRPDVPGLARLVVADLEHERSRGFGSHRIHALLLTEQLDDCVRLKPDLLNTPGFVNVYLTRLWPSPDVDWRRNAAEREAYLDRLWAFVSRLNDSQNSLKAHVLYHRLVHDRARGAYDMDHFMTYLRLPKHTGYVSRDYMKDRYRQRHAVDLAADFSGSTQLPRVGDDESLVRGYLEHFLVTADDVSAFAELVQGDYLKRVFATTKILAGRGDMERWYSMLPAAELQALRDRIDIDFAPTNSEFFDVGEQVALDVHVKNVRSLIIKVFEINTLNYYRDLKKEVDTAIDLDGLVPNEQRTETYDEPPIRRVARHFEFPGLKARGTYVIEFIGNGVSSRALIRRGQLRHVVRSSTAGHVFAILGESGQSRPNAALWVDGHEYRPREDGTIVVPYSNRPGPRPIVLVDGDLATLDSFIHEAETYALHAGIHIDRETLVRRRPASVIVRPSLTVNGMPRSLSVLEDVALTITTVDGDGVDTTKVFEGFALHEDRESIQEFQVPARLRRISVRMSARVENLSRGEKQDLAVERTFQINGIDATEKIEDIHLSLTPEGYVLDVLGKTGESRPRRPVRVELKHRDFRDAVVVTLQSEDDGSAGLGALDGIQWVAALGADGAHHRWYLLDDRHSLPRSLHGAVGATLSIPYMGVALERDELSLLEIRGTGFSRDRFEALSLEGGFLRLSGLAAGDYELTLKSSGTRVAIRISDGDETGLPGQPAQVVSSHRRLERRNTTPLQIVSVDTGDETVSVRLANAGPFTRVHVAATRFVPEFDPYVGLDAVPFAEPVVATSARPRSLYVVGRDIGDEQRYVLERAAAVKFPGNMLARPNLLLNPWALRTTDTEVRAARPGSRFQRVGDPGSSAASREAAPAEGLSRQDLVGFTSLDFLGRDSAVVLTNLRPDESGLVAIHRDELGRGQIIHVIAVDPENTASRRAVLPRLAPRFADLRLRAGLDPEKHFAEQSDVTIVRKDARFKLDDITTSELEVYDSLDRVYALFTSLTHDESLAKFAFVLRWPELSAEEKRALYSRHACHELNFFLQRKDPEFFDAEIRPYLANKFDKTFLDHWLLGSDLRSYSGPWAYARLNIVERILLSRRIAGEGPRTRRHLEDLLELVPRDVAQLTTLFKTALRGRALETGDDFGLAGAKDKQVRQLMARTKALAQSGRGGGAAAPPAAAAPMEAESLSLSRRSRKRANDLAKKETDESLAEDSVEAAAENKFYFEAELRDRAEIRQLFRQIERTREWAENNYWELPIERQNAELVTVNPFWTDFAKHDGTGPFLSTHVASASRNFTEMFLALAVLDLPFKASEHKTEITDATFTLDAASPLLVFHKEIREAGEAAESVPILVSRNFYRHDDRYRQVRGERVEKYVTDEFLVHTVYGCKVVVTNSTASRQALDVLLEIPRGSIPVLGGEPTRSVHIELEPYHTWTHDYSFYFPAAGEFVQYPIHVAKDEIHVAAAEPATLRVVTEATRIDRESWTYISQHGSAEEVLEAMRGSNLNAIELDRIAWRMKDAPFATEVLALLRARHVYSHTLWSYALLHDMTAEAREFLNHEPRIAAACGRSIDTPLLTIDPVERKSYQHLEYWPLVNARAHRLGKRRTILNDRLFAQYGDLLAVLRYRPAFDAHDLMSVTGYLLVQDRTREALDFFSRVRPADLDARIQYDAFATYLAISTEKLPTARTLASKYVSHPVERWREYFTSVTSQLDEIEGAAGSSIVDDDDLGQKQTRLADTAPQIDFEIEGGRVALRSRNLERATVNYYLMDLELLFSRSPFVARSDSAAGAGRFSYIRPNMSVELDLSATAGEEAAQGGARVHVFEVPERFRSTNVLVEISGGGVQRTRTHFANALVLELVESYAQLRVTDGTSGKALPKVYVKVYARMHDGSERFYKDGYTDLRGRFDYGSLSTSDLDSVERFSILVLSDERGAVVREVSPPRV